MQDRVIPRSILTFTGKSFFPLDPNPEAFDINDIAHALSNQCRFSGHSRFFYSVAQHSYYVSLIVESLGGSHMDQLCGLLHDASEAYLVDLPTPVKEQVVGYHDAESKVMNEFCKWAEITPYLEFSSLVKRADEIALATEARDLMGNPNWNLNESPVDWKIERWKHDVTASVFRVRYQFLKEKVNFLQDKEVYWAGRYEKFSLAYDPRRKHSLDDFI